MKASHLLRKAAAKTFAKGALSALLLIALPGAAWPDLAIPVMPADGSLTVEQLESAIRAVEASEDIGDESLTKVVEQLRDAQLQVQNRIAAEAAATAYAQALDSVPAETLRLRATLDNDVVAPPTAESLGIDDRTVLAELEQALSKASGDLAAVDARWTELESQIKTQEGRPAKARERINELSRSRAELSAMIELPPPPNELQALTEARQLSATLKRSAQAAELKQLELELLSHAVRLRLSNTQREVAARSIAYAQRRVEFIRARLNDARQAAALLAQQSAAEIELAAAEKHPVVRALAEGNAALTRELPAIAASIEQTSAALERVENQGQEVEQRLAQSRQRLEVAGVSRVIGRLLVDEKRNLPQVSQYRSEVRKRRTTLAEIGLAQVRIQEQQRELTPLESRVEAAMAEVAADVTGEEQLAEVRSEVRLLLRDRREMLNQADNSYRSYLQVLGDLDVAQRRLLDLAAQYEEFLDQNLIWIPSAPIMGTGSWRELGPAAVWALSPSSWIATSAATLREFREHLAATIFVALMFVLLLITRRPLSARYKSINSRVGQLSTDNVGLTLAALAIAAFRVLPLPLLFAVIGWAIERGEEQSPFSIAVAQAFLAIAPFIYYVLLFRVLCAQNGVARVHFGWREKSVALIRRQLDRLLVAGVPFGFASVLLYASELATDRATLGRVAFVGLMVTLSLVIGPLAHPDSGLPADYYKRHPMHWISRLKWFWYALAAGSPLLLGLLSLIGYIYASAVLTGLLIDTIWLALGIVVVNMVALRWLALAHRKLAWQIAQKESEEQREEREKEAVPQGEGELPVIESKPLDLDSVDQQTRKLLQSGLFLVGVLAGWGIWAEVIPAFDLLDRFALWSQTVMVDGVETIAPVTLADILLAVLVAIAAVVASKNLPGLMEIVVLQRLTLQPGNRYAINTLVRYVVVTVGTISVLNIVGWDWSQIQWLVAALSIGLGFGLQEIVANFVSGLIILFERPVRVGDTVTVGALTGTVSRVRIRATTITDWDRKEIIVPNKAFITEQVINWTLSDPITRVLVPVGISYGSDVQLATRVMEDTLRSLPLVLDDPQPSVYFMGFGESSLDFNLYVYSKQLADRFPLMHAVHESILAALRSHDIEIPFPQRDLHVRSTVESPSEQGGDSDHN